MRNFLRDITISMKISILIGLTVLLMTAVMGLGLKYINTIGNEITAIAKEDIPLLEAVSKITYHSLEQSIHLERAIQFGKHMAQDKAAKDNFEIERKNFLKHTQMIAQEIEKNRVFVERMSKKYLRTHRREKRILQVDYVLRSIGKECADYEFLAERVFNLLSQGKLTEAEPTIQKITKESKEEEHFEAGKPLENLTLAVEGFAEDSIIRTEEDKQTVLIAMSLVSASILLFSMGFGIFISHGIRKPLKMAVNTAERIAAGDRNFEIEVTTKDETGQLLQALKTMSFAVRNAEESLIKQASELAQSNTTLQNEVVERKNAEAELKAAQEKLIETAHRAGMAEVAADVLHNVGNILNSINVSTTVIREKVTNSELANLEKVASIINEHTDDLGTFLTEHPQGKHIPVYLTEVSKCLTDEQTVIIDKLKVLTENIQHIKDIVSMQQEYAKVSGVEVQTSLSGLAEDAIQINSAGLERHGTRLIREFEELGDVEIDKQRVLQILVNLISNAKYALSDSNKEEKLLTIRIYKHCEARFRIEVADNSVGISEDNLVKIFSHGFTTKERGHGFGLHSCALASKEMGGSLTVHSDGVGQGATFTLELPFKPIKVIK